MIEFKLGGAFEVRLRLAPTRKLRPFLTKNCAFEVVFSVVIRSSKKTGRSPLRRFWLASKLKFLEPMGEGNRMGEKASHA